MGIAVRARARPDGSSSLTSTDMMIAMHRRCHGIGLGRRWLVGRRNLLPLCKSRARLRWLTAVRGALLLLFGAMASPIDAPAQVAVPAALPFDSTTTDTSWTEMPLVGRAIPCVSGRIKGFVCRNVELLSYLPKHMLGESSGYDLWGWHDSATGREFVVIGGHSTAFVEVTDPVNPRYLGVLPPREGYARHGAQSVKVYQHYALIGYVGIPGIQIVDLTQLRNAKSPPVVIKETAYYDGVGTTHTIAVNQATGFAYVNGSDTCGGGLHMVDVRTPTQPVLVGCHAETLGGRKRSGEGGYVHDAQCVVYRGPDSRYRGREICVTYAEIGFGIVDVTDKQNVRTISVASYPNVAYTHQGWFSKDYRYLYVGDELDEMAMRVAHKGVRDSVWTRTIVFDVSDLDDPVVATEYYAPTHAADHNLYVRGRYLYQANYDAGLRILNIADPTQPKEVGYLADPALSGLDPVERRRTGALGAWGAYPYLKNGVVAVSMSSGLLLARLRKR